MEMGDQKREAPPQAPPESPKPEAPDWLYKNIEEVSKNAATVYFVFMGFLAYAALTAATTSDRGLILNDNAHLPIVNMDVSANGFFIIAPLLVILVFLYLQLYVQRQMRLLNYLSRHYDHLEGRRLYPWIVNIAAYPDRGIMGELQRLTVTLCIWVAPIIVLNIISLSYIRKHEPFWSYFVAGLALVGTLLILFFWRWYGSRRKHGHKLRLVVEYSAILVLLVYEISVLLLLVPWANEGALAPEWAYRPSAIAVAQMGGKKLPDIIESASRLVWLDLSYQKLVEEPKVDYPGLYWQSLQGTHLEGADLFNSILKRANLSKAHLNYASLYGAILEGADLFRADLRQADLFRANFSEANLVGADFSRADFSRANLQEANLSAADFSQADFSRADFSEASLVAANCTS